MMMAMGNMKQSAQIDQPQWRPIPPELSDGLTRAKLPRRRARTWALVLQARGMAYRLEQQGAEWQLLVPVNDYATAVHELRSYEENNRNWPPPQPKEQERPDNSSQVIVILLLLAVFHHLTRVNFSLFGASPIDWLAHGHAHAEKILQGEWWRVLTALTLHSGWLHLFSNLCIGSLFIVRLCRDLGAGLGWTLVIAASALGNLINAILQQPDHRSIGASTAVFGAVGVLAAINLLRYRLSLYRRWALPVAGALGLLALLGASGENTDLGAHLFGFAVGLGVGLVTEYLLERYGRPGKELNLLLATGSGALVLLSWLLAIF